jgi:hypothetical protein
VQQQRSLSQRYFPQTSACVQLNSRALLCGSSSIKVITCISVVYLIGTYCYIQILVVRRFMKIDYGHFYRFMYEISFTSQQLQM